MASVTDISDTVQPGSCIIPDSRCHRFKTKLINDTFIKNESLSDSCITHECNTIVDDIEFILPGLYGSVYYVNNCQNNNIGSWGHDRYLYFLYGASYSKSSKFKFIIGIFLVNEAWNYYDIKYITDKEFDVSSVSTPCVKCPLSYNSDDDYYVSYGAGTNIMRPISDFSDINDYGELFNVIDNINVALPNGNNISIDNFDVNILVCNDNSNGYCIKPIVMPSGGNVCDHIIVNKMENGHKLQLMMPAFAYTDDNIYNDFIKLESLTEYYTYKEINIYPIPLCDLGFDINKNKTKSVKIKLIITSLTPGHNTAINGTITINPDICSENDGERRCKSLANPDNEFPPIEKTINHGFVIDGETGLESQIKYYVGLVSWFMAGYNYNCLYLVFEDTQQVVINGNNYHGNNLMHLSMCDVFEYIDQ
jgi:hypothetical protein